ncbi:hypothetical protein CSV79_01795 [Sporosarcina sp. P13]|uniref:hypothetical protein n=1 Tax=Sporosarcina sp. P13 TaxID=2048263 RepID=UPI000C1713AC|nr:hypothetical protein [Sporosarcina sp. P13]PIC65378.1 hypothetical protein CSV79_01795 [Sporosarcina sp. P13]
MVNICEPISDSLFKGHFQKHLKSRRQSTTGTVPVLINRIEQLIENPDEKEMFESFLVDELKFNKNKQLFYNHLGLTNRGILKTPKIVKQKLTLNSVPDTPFNDLLKEEPKNNEILFLDYTIHNREIELIEMCIFKEIFPKGDKVEYLYNYVWVELNIKNDYMIVRVRNQQHMQNFYTTRSIYLEVRSMIENIFSVHLNINMLPSKETLYNMYKEFILKAELPYHNLVNENNDIIVNSQIPMFKKLGIREDSNTAETIINRYKKLIERILTLEDFAYYTEPVEAPKAKVTKISMSDDTGASAYIQPNDIDGLEIATIYFDVRDTIDEMKTLNKLWLTWNHETINDQLDLFNATTSTFEKYPTRFEVYRDYVIITFMEERSVDKEVQQYVFEAFREFE